MMNILFLDSIDKSTYGGMEEWIRLVASGMVSRGHEVAVAGREGSEFLRRVKEQTTGVALMPMDISGDFNPATIAHIKRFIADNATDVICVNFNKDVRLGGLAARLDGRARVVWSVGLDITRDSLVHKFLTPRLVDGVIVPSESLKQQITRLGYIRPETVSVIPIGIPDLAETTSSSEAAVALRRKYQLPKDSLIAVTSGRFVDQKGHIHLVAAAAQIIRACPQIRFLWLGKGPLESDLRARIAALGHEANFVFAGMLDSCDLELAGADMMIHPSVEEPFGISVLEGLRAALPVVASRVGGIPEVVGGEECAVLVEPGNSRSLADAVTELAGDWPRRQEMGAKARDRFEKVFADVLMYDRVEQCFQLILRTERCHGKA